MKDYIKERSLELSDYILKSKATVRECAKLFCISKSTVHKEVGNVNKKLMLLNYLSLKLRYAY